jgi:hypothetical protein
MPEAEIAASVAVLWKHRVLRVFEGVRVYIRLLNGRSSMFECFDEEVSGREQSVLVFVACLGKRLSHVVPLGRH